MRITNQLTSFNTLSNYRASQTDIYNLNNRFSSGLKIQNSYDDSGIYVDGTRLEYEINLLDQVKETTTKASEFSKNSDQALSDFVKQLENFKTKLIQSANDMHDATSRNAIANDLDSIKTHLQTIANTSINGQYLFSGTALDTKPVDSEGNYKGNSETIEAVVGANQTVPYNLNGYDLFLGKDNDYNKILTTNVSLHNQRKEANEKLDSVYLQTTDTIKDMIGRNYYSEDLLKQDPNKDPDKDQVVKGYNTTFFMQGKDANGNSFAKKFTLTPDASIQSLLDEIGYALGNDKNGKNKLVDVTLNNSGQIEVKDIKKGNNLLDFHIVGLTSQRTTETYKIGNTNLTITGGDKGNFKAKFENGELVLTDAKNANTKYTIKADANGITVNNQKITGTNLVIDPADLANGVDQQDFKTFNEKDVEKYSYAGSRDRDGNWVFPDQFTSLEEVDYNVQNGLAYVTEFIKSDFSKDNGSKNLASDYNRLRFAKDSNTLTGNVSQIVKSTNEYATDATKLSEVAGASLNTLSTLDMNIVAKNGEKYKVSIKFLPDKNNNKPIESELTISKADDNFKAQQPAVYTSKIYNGVYDDAKKTTNAVVTKPEDITYRQLSDIISVVASNNIPNLQPNATDQQKYEAFFVKAVQDSSTSVDVGLNYRGQLEIKDKSNSVTPIEISVFENTFNSGEFMEGMASGSMLSFNANNAITIDESNVDIFKDLEDMIKAVRSGSYRANADDGNNARTTGIQGALKRIDHLMDHINKQHTQIGSYTNLLSSTNDRVSTLKVNVSTVKSEIMDADYGETYIMFQQRLIGYQAMLQATSKINQVSLLNYM
ncbi:flagellin N-terminal helical domain-containing protein [Campylobacter hyointestinalis]|uniref:Flagellin n=1 Tax=Campylobacter hyointestinalis subsp. lawsonii TaxID=91353 RepID=A0AAV6EF79_CAMHY|nr:flagellin [Campylobacter hyointestinalis]KAB0612810.1 flagellar hook protein [Campylobacter hyointestinalis subsp. lawsonii]QKF69571.1 distal flagellar hook-filament junction protein [Campylobacter hyointestinalis subsp. lawsonii]RAZ29366.1 flagellar hook protein [Campylobacter hyointestinalis subsp. lawsonii]